MADKSDFDSWSAGDSYEHYMGRWSRLIAARFLDWLGAPQGADWVEIGCGSGALTASVLAQAAPRAILATDASADFVAHARGRIDDARARFEVADARALPLPDGSVDVVASALVLNFVPDRVAALREMRRVLRPGGMLSFYVWDYPGGGMGFIDAFWKAAAEVDPKAAELDEATRFPFCTAQGIAALAAEAGLAGAEVAAIEAETRFDDFEAFWMPFTGGAGPAPGFAKSLDEAGRARLKDALRARVGDAGPVSLPARAWGLRATV